MDEKINLTSISGVLTGIEELLLYKNRKYGNSARNPINVFSKSGPVDGILQRLDDKLKRIQNSPDLRKNDISDLIGYLTLLCVEKGWNNFKEFMD